jgi:hypothetical protein
MLQREIFIVECSSVDGLATRAVAVREVACLNHEVLHNSMKNYALKVNIKV